VHSVNSWAAGNWRLDILEGWTTFQVKGGTADSLRAGSVRALATLGRKEEIVHWTSWHLTWEPLGMSCVSG
jgi:hypothetical protein